MSSVDEIMKKAVTSSASFYADPNSNKGYLQRKEQLKAERKEQKNTLSQWYGMKRCAMTPEVKQELELLRYRNFLNKDTAHKMPQRSGCDSEFVEFGYFSDVGKRKRTQYKSFADEWVGENEELAQLVEKRMKIKIKKDKENKKAKEARAKKAEKAKKGAEKKVSKRKRHTGA